MVSGQSDDTWTAIHTVTPSPAATATSCLEHGSDVLISSPATDDWAGLKEIRQDMTTDLLKAVMAVEEHADHVTDDIVTHTFVSFDPFYSSFASPANQIVFGRRGAGKTHALRYLAQARLAMSSDITVYVDMRLIGSRALFSSTAAPHERAADAFIDVIKIAYKAIFQQLLARVTSIDIDQTIAMESLERLYEDATEATVTARSPEHKHLSVAQIHADVNDLLDVLRPAVMAVARRVDICSQRSSALLG